MATMTPAHASEIALPTPPETLPAARRKRPWWGLAFMAPAMFFLLVFVLVPAAQGTMYAFTDWDGLSQDFSFIGLDNFREIFVDPLGKGAVIHTLVLTVVTVVLQTVIGLGLAVGLNTRIKAKGLLRLLFFAPVIVAPIIVAKLWAYMYVPEGPIDSVLSSIGLGGLNQLWIGDPGIALYSVMLVIVWQYAGLAMVIFLSGLQNVPDETLEAARIDGAGAWRTFWSVVLPQLRPAFVVATALGVLTGLKTFDQVWVLTQGGPGTSTHTLSTAMYQAAFVFGRYGYGTALAVFLSVIAIVAVVLQRLALKGDD